MSNQLESGQQIHLLDGKDNESAIVRIRLSWATPQRKSFIARAFESLGAGAKAAVDIEAIAMLFDGGGESIDTVWRKKVYSSDGFVEHLGDDQDRRNESIRDGLKRDVWEDIIGKARAGSESVLVDLKRLPERVEEVIFTISSFSSDDMARIGSTCWQVENADSGTEIARFVFAHDDGINNSRIMGKLRRNGLGWTATAIGRSSQGRTMHDFVAGARRYVGGR